jgi:hypothetical protein
MNAVSRAATSCSSRRGSGPRSRTSGATKALYLGYIAILALLPATATLVSTWLIGSPASGGSGPASRCRPLS